MKTIGLLLGFLCLSVSFVYAQKISKNDGDEATLHEKCSRPSKSGGIAAPGKVKGTFRAKPDTRIIKNNLP